MLVLSRRENQKILFPNLGITVEIVGVKGRSVRLGIEAPPEIRILRAELADEDERAELATSDELLTRHERNNRLNTAALQIQVAEKLLKRGADDQAIPLLEKSLQMLRDLDQDSKHESVPVSTTENSHPKWKALLVEDDVNERQLMASILRMCGFSVDVVGDGAEAVEYLKSNSRPDCVLMDMQMPGMSGPEAISTIRKEVELQNIPIYGVSGLDRQEANVPLGDRGVSGWFSKPVDADRMLKQIIGDFCNNSGTKPALN